MESGKVITGAVEADGRADKRLAEASGLSRARVQALIRDGRVEIAGERASAANRKLLAGTRFTIHLPAPTPSRAQPQPIALDILFEDEALIVVDKPAGMVVHPAAGNRDGTLVNALLFHCKGQLSGIGGVARPGIVHRIDKDTSGLLVVAKTDAAHEGLARQFADHSIARKYLALCAGHPKPSAGTISGRIGRSDKNRKKMAVLEPDSTRGKHAVTHYRIEERLRESALIGCTLETGRTHQIRVHLASIGHALLGDPVYGTTPKALRDTLREEQFARQALHAAELGFVHPISGAPMRFSSAIPADMARLIDRLRQ